MKRNYGSAWSTVAFLAAACVLGARPSVIGAFTNDRFSLGAVGPSAAGPRPSSPVGGGGSSSAGGGSSGGGSSSSGSGSSGEDAYDDAGGGGSSGSGGSGFDAALSKLVMKRAARVAAAIWKGGGYRFDGVNDCYGFLRRTWDPLLSRRGRRKLPTGDFPSPNWRRVKRWSDLRPGDVLATHDGHKWGPTWHGGLYAGRTKGGHLIFDNARPGPRVRRHPPGLFDYYYVPVHKLLTR